MRIKKKTIDERLNEYKNLINTVSNKNVWSLIMLLCGGKKMDIYEIESKILKPEKSIKVWLNKLIELKVIEVWQDYPYPEKYEYLKDNPFAEFITRFQYIEGFKELSMYKRCQLIKKILSFLTSDVKGEILDLLPMSVKSISENTGMLESNIEHHLSLLKKCNLVENKNGVFCGTDFLKTIKKNLK